MKKNILKPFKPGITHYFFLFLAFACVIPFLTFSILLLNSASHRLKNQREHQLAISRMLFESELENSIEQLLLVAEEFSIYSSLHSPEHITPGNRHKIQRFLERLKAREHLSFVCLIEQDGRILLHTRAPFQTERQMAEQNEAVMAAVQNQVTARKPFVTVESLQQPKAKNKKNALYFIAGAPVFASVSKNSLRDETIIIGREASSIFKEIRQAGQNPGKRLQAFVQTHNVNIPPHIQAQLVSPDSVLASQILNGPRQFSLIEEEMFYLAVYLIIVAILVGSAVYAFYNGVITPLFALMQVSSEVSRQRFDVEVHCPQAKGEIRQTIQQFNDMVKQLANAETMRNTFIASLSHDLRTPLLSEKRVLELFQEYKDELPPQFVKLTENLKDSNLYLIEMVNTILEVYQYDAGKVAVSYEPINVEDLVAEAITRTEPLAAKKQITLMSDIVSAFPFLVADRQQMLRVLINLIGNAVENIPKGCKIEITAKFTDELVTICVCDNGPGIPKEKLSHLFDGQYRAKKLGSGLGLYICRCIVDAHQGRLEIASNGTDGTCITLALPNPSLEAIGKKEAEKKP